MPNNSTIDKNQKDKTFTKSFKPEEGNRFNAEKIAYEILNQLYPFILASRLIDSDETNKKLVLDWFDTSNSLENVLHEIAEIERNIQHSSLGEAQLKEIIRAINHLRYALFLGQSLRLAQVSSALDGKIQRQEQNPDYYRNKIEESLKIINDNLGLKYSNDMLSQMANFLINGFDFNSGAYDCMPKHAIVDYFENKCILNIINQFKNLSNQSNLVPDIANSIKVYDFDRTGVPVSWLDNITYLAVEPGYRLNIDKMKRGFSLVQLLIDFERKAIDDNFITRIHNTLFTDETLTKEEKTQRVRNALLIDLFDYLKGDDHNNYRQKICEKFDIYLERQYTNREMLKYGLFRAIREIAHILKEPQTDKKSNNYQRLFGYTILAEYIIEELGSIESNNNLDYFKEIITKLKDQFSIEFNKEIAIKNFYNTLEEVLSNIQSESNLILNIYSKDVINYVEIENIYLNIFDQIKTLAETFSHVKEDIIINLMKAAVTSYLYHRLNQVYSEWEKSKKGNNIATFLDFLKNVPLFGNLNNEEYSSLRFIFDYLIDRNVEFNWEYVIEKYTNKVRSIEINSDYYIALPLYENVLKQIHSEKGNTKNFQYSPLKLQTQAV
ncbi:MAG: hypothetical protein QXE31_05235 [Candidatus Woesearchaeota archaeon]